ncbi:uncharacterized protein LOC127799882 isoform X2 [Diospyros lotus]|uniref:uncharacterized protein LOC127799882 isoform X2 n=1 Tax=Diospyros lotus TaxID=55363 RepID=UPI00225038FD|nr:uncharacterized protein LOC127799882 isoform X2 [Diospyros lotus]
MEIETSKKSARTRLQSELADSNSNPPAQISFGPATDDDDGMFHWQGIIIGPMGTHLEGDLFHLSIQFPVDYPFSPPHIKFQTQVCHPNIGADGTVHINILTDQWSSALTAEKLLLSVCSLLLDPILADRPILNLYQEQQEDHNYYRKQARSPWWNKRIWRCWSRINSLVNAHSYSSKRGRKKRLSVHCSI